MGQGGQDESLVLGVLRYGQDTGKQLEFAPFVTLAWAAAGCIARGVANHLSVACYLQAGAAGLGRPIRLQLPGAPVTHCTKSAEDRHLVQLSVGCV